MEDDIFSEVTKCLPPFVSLPAKHNSNFSIVWAALMQINQVAQSCGTLQNKGGKQSFVNRFVESNQDLSAAIVAD